MTDEPEPRRSRWWLAGGVTLAVVALVMATLLIVNGGSLPGLGADGGKCASDSYERAEFSAPMEPVAISPNGKYIVGSPDDYEAEGFGLWHDGEYEVVEPAPGEEGYLEVSDVNDSGTVLGQTDGDEATVSWTYADGEYRPLEGLAGSPDADTVAINNDGTVAGQVLGDDDMAPVVWKAGATTPTRLEMPEDRNGYVEDISEAGVVAGTLSYDDDDKTRDAAWLWDAKGQGTDLLPKAVFEDWDRSGSASATAVNGDWVLIVGRPETIRVNVADGYRADALKTGGAETIDEFGRLFTTRKDLPVVYDEKPYPLPGMNKPPNNDSEDGYEEDPAYNVVIAAAADGSVVYGKSFDDDRFLWTCGK